MLGKTATVALPQVASPQPILPQSRSVVVCMCPMSTKLPRFSTVSRSLFNNIRIDLVNALIRYMSSSMSGVTKEDRIKVSADAWLESSTQISFDALPRIVDLDALPVLQKLGLIGVYWFVNHSDNNGALSCGQVYDLLFSLDVLRNEKLERAWPAHFHTDFVNMLQSCVDATVGFSFRLDEIDAPTPQQQQKQHVQLEAAAASISEQYEASTTHGRLQAESLWSL